MSLGPVISDPINRVSRLLQCWQVTTNPSTHESVPKKQTTVFMQTGNVCRIVDCWMIACSACTKAESERTFLMCGIYLEEGRRCHCSQADARDEISGAKVRTGSCSSVEKLESERRARNGSTASSWPRPSDQPPSGSDLLPREMTETRGRKKTASSRSGR